jgi:Tol biopolymer transport system component
MSDSQGGKLAYNSRFTIRAAALCLVLFGVIHNAFAQREVSRFGKNKVRYTKIQWRYFTTPHFEIYFYDKAERTARRVGEIAEEFYDTNKQVLGFDLDQPNKNLTQLLVEKDKIDRMLEEEERLARGKKLKRRAPAKIKEPAPMKPKKLKLFLYNGHNEFQQNNIIDTHTRGLQLPEGVGGVTEYMKNRIAIPDMEGSLKELAMVTRHELVHQFLMAKYEFDFKVGKIPLPFKIPFPPPLPVWANEGLAEWLAQGFDKSREIQLRNRFFAINRMLTLQELEQGGYMSYVGGPAFWMFIQDNFGAAAITDILNWMQVGIPERGKLARIGDYFYRAIYLVTKLAPAELNDRWIEYLRRRYAQDLEKQNSLNGIAKLVVKSDAGPGSLNFSPTLSPDGTRLAYITNRPLGLEVVIRNVDPRGKSGPGRTDPAVKEKYAFLQNAVRPIVRTLIKGGRSNNFEELHLVSQFGQYRNLSFSPDGKFLALAAKKSAHGDVIYLIDTSDGSISKQYSFKELNGLYSPVFSPNGDSLAFVGLKLGVTDVYRLNRATGTITNLTQDDNAEYEPIFSPDGQSVFYVSEQPTPGVMMDAILKALSFHDLQFDLFKVHTQTFMKERLTQTPDDELSPVVFPEGTRIAYLSDHNGLNNLYVKDLQTNEEKALTNVRTGLKFLSMSANGTRVAFNMLTPTGYDLYVMGELQGRARVETTPTRAQEQLEEARKARTETVLLRKSPLVDYSAKISPEPKKYKMKLSPDFYLLSGGYMKGTGVSINGQGAVSDLSGDHGVIAAGNINLARLDTSDIILMYNNRTGRADKSVGLYRTSVFFREYETAKLGQLNNTGVALNLSYPFTRSDRVEAGASASVLQTEYLRGTYKWGQSIYDYPKTGEKEQVDRVMLSAVEVHDTVLYNQLGDAVDGTRSKLMIIYSPEINRRSREFTTAMFDWRKYVAVSPSVTLAARLSGGASFGADPQKFYVGGQEYLFTRHYRDRALDYRERMLNNFATPVRGTDVLGKMQGTKYLLSNIDIRLPFPLFDHLATVKNNQVTPIGAYFVQMNAFIDQAIAFDDKLVITTRENGRIRFKDYLATYGIELNAFVMMARIKITQGWEVDPFQPLKAQPKTQVGLGVRF